VISLTVNLAATLFQHAGRMRPKLPFVPFARKRRATSFGRQVRHQPGRSNGKDIAAIVLALFTNSFRKDYFAGRGRKLRRGSPTASRVESLMFLETSAATFYLGWKIWGEAVQLPHTEEVGYMVLDHIQTSTAPSVKVNPAR
jgi:hypothetical protein